MSHQLSVSANNDTDLMVAVVVREADTACVSKC